MLGLCPNGRKSGLPLYDGSMSPMGGMDTGGPTNTLGSVLKAVSERSCLNVLTQKFNAKMLESEESQEKMVALTRTFLDNGGNYIQYNLVDADELRDAQKHPENHRDLMVRVGGFSAYFITLTSALQEEIIGRSSHQI